VERSTWVFGNAEVWIFSENSSGVYGSKVTEYCFLKGVQLSASLPIVRRAVTGRGRRRLLPLSGSYEDVNMQVDHMMFRLATEYDTSDVFNPLKQLRVVLRFFNLIYTNAAPFENDQLELSFARATQFSISGQENESINAKASFEAELLLASADNNRVPANLLV
jgi:hypothetical protein